MWSSFNPDAIIFTIGNLQLHWYGLIVTLSGVVAFFITKKLAIRQGINDADFFDLIFYLIIFGFLGGRLYHVMLEYGYYSQHLGEILAIWRGGLGIHGGIIAGLVVLLWFTKKHKLNFWHLSDILVIGLILAQAIGRWGNFFNQELFGKPTSVPWKIFINPEHRPQEFMNISYFHPTFLYESLLNLLLFIILLVLYRMGKLKSGTITFFYLIGYSLIRFSLEFIRIDPTPEIFDLRFPQVVSIIIIIFSIWFLYKRGVKKKLA